MSVENQNSNRIFGLDFVRATAILFVVFSHIYYLIDDKNPILIALSGLFGYAGVELFFVLSGFLIGSILLKKYVENQFSKKELIAFLKRRWFRTLPSYYLVLIINIVLVFIFQYPNESIWKYFLFIQNLYQNNITFFTESWSLSIEEWTYIVMPLVLFIGGKLIDNKKYAFLFFSIAIILFSHLLRFYNYSNNQVYDMETWNSHVKSIVLLRIDSIVFGFLIAWFYFFKKEQLKKYCVYLFIISIHLFFLQFLFMNLLGVEIITSPIYFHIFYFTLSSLTFALALPMFIFWKKSGGIFASITTFLSKISYSMYLLHYSIMSVVVKFIISELGLNFSKLIVISIYLTLTLSFSYILYRFYEKPLMDLRDKI